MPKKKDILKKVKEQLKNRRNDIIKELDRLYKSREDFGAGCDQLTEINSAIDQKIEEISQIDADMARKDKKSSAIEWIDTEYKAPGRGNNARAAKVVDVSELEELRSKQGVIDNGPNCLWLKPGILVKTKNRTMPGIVVDIRSRYATVLFGGSEVDMRKLALRPAEWED